MNATPTAPFRQIALVRDDVAREPDALCPRPAVGVTSAQYDEIRASVRLLAKTSPAFAALSLAIDRADEAAAELHGILHRADLTSATIRATLDAADGATR